MIGYRGWGKLPILSGTVAFQFEPIGWESNSDSGDGDYRHDGPPPDEAIESGDVLGILVIVYDEDNPANNDIFWAYPTDEIYDWDDWFDFIAGMMAMYGFASAG